jgi:SH3-like domain-containing protein
MSDARTQRVSPDQVIAGAAAALRVSRQQLDRVLAEHCPGPHVMLSDPDGSWCRACGRTDEGQRHER